MAKAKTGEAAVQQCITDLLNAMRIPWFRQNVGAMPPIEYERKDGSKGKRFVRFGLKGMADLQCWPQVKTPCVTCGGLVNHAVTLWLEVKAPGRKDQLNPNQKLFRDWVTANGMLYLVADDVEDVLQFLNNELQVH